MYTLLSFNAKPSSVFVHMAGGGYQMVLQYRLHRPAIFFIAVTVLGSPNKIYMTTATVHVSPQRGIMGI